MKATEPSPSAAIIAAHRAYESAKPEAERVCHDPLAERLIPPGLTVVGRSDIPEETAIKLFRDFVPGFHEFFVARTRYLDDYLQSCIDDGLEQLVILGAGYDSRAYRFEQLKENAKVFEVDHPATQEVKQDRLRAVFGVVPEHVVFVPIDFQTQDLGARLAEQGYDTQLTTLFLWEGVTMYIDAKAVDNTLGFIAGNSGSGSSVIFDFTFPEVVAGTHERKEAQFWHGKAADSGEDLAFGIRPEALEGFLTERGFGRVSCVTHEFFNTNYFNRAGDDRQSTPILALAHVVVEER